MKLLMIIMITTMMIVTTTITTAIPILPRMLSIMIIISMTVPLSLIQ